MSRTAETANLTGVSMDKLLGYLAATGEVTQKSMSSIGESFKTIFTRMADIKAGKLELIDEDGTSESLSDVETVLNNVGIKLRESNNEFRNFGDVLDDVAAAWDSYSSVQKAAISKAFAGTRQSENFKVLMENYTSATSYMQTAMNSAGTAEKKYSAYLDSIEAKTKSLQASFESLAVNTFSTKQFGGIIDATTAVVTFLDKTNLLKSSLAGIAGAGAIKVFTMISAGITNAVARMNEFNTALTLLKVGNIGDSQLQKLIKLTSNLSNSQLKAVLSSTALSNQQRIAILTANGMSNAEAKATLTTMGLATAEGTATTATTSLSGALKGLWATLKANPLVLIAGAITAVVTAFNAFSQAAEEAEQRAEENFNKLTEAAQAATDTRVSVGSLIEQYKKLADAMDGTWSAEEASELKGIQEQITSLVGDQASNLDLVNGKIDEEYQKLLSIYNLLSDDELASAESAYNVSQERFNKGYEHTGKSFWNSYAGDSDDLAAWYIMRAYEEVINPGVSGSKWFATEYLGWDKDTNGYAGNLGTALEQIGSYEEGLDALYEWQDILNTAKNTSALEYNNGALQLNAEKVNELVKANAETQISLNDTNKAVAQSKYLENAAEIEKLRKQLDGLNDDESSARAAIQSNIDTLLAENSTLKNVCTQYDLMSASLREATSAYQHWLNAQGAAQSGDMFDDTLSAMNHINDTLNNKDSELYGRVGRTDYEAAVNLIIPDNIDTADKEAVNSYMDSIYSLFTYDDDGNRAGLNIDNFCRQAVDQGLMYIDEASGSYQIAGQKTMEDFANGLNLSLPLVQAMFGEMEEFGGAFDWSDDANKTFGDLAISATEAREALFKIGENDNLEIKLDVSDIEDTQGKIDALDSTIAEMNGIKSKPEVDPSEIEYANEIIRYCVAQKQLLSQPDVMMVDTSVVEGDLGNAISLLQEFQTARNNLETAQALGIDTTQAQANLDAATQKIQDLDSNITSEKALNIDTTSIDTISASLANLSADLIVKAGVDESAVIGYQQAEHDAQGTVTWDNDTSLVDIYAAANHYSEGTIAWYNDTSLVKTKFYAQGYITWSGQQSANGTAHASGTAYAGGNWGTAPGGKTLVGELGQEIVVDPHTGRWYTVGDHGAEFKDIPRGAIVFNNKQTESLLNNGYVASRASALVGGTAMVTGGIGIGSANNSTVSGGYSTNNYKKSSSSTNDELETFDWIEVAIARIERVIDQLKTTATSTYKALKTKLGATYDEIVMVNQALAIQQKSYDRYLLEANNIGLSSDLVTLVQNGAIDISQYDKDTQNLIEKYQEFYQKALDCADAVQQLRENLGALYENSFNDTATDYENQLSQIGYSHYDSYRSCTGLQ